MGYTYQKRGREQTQARADQTGGTFDQFLRAEFGQFKPKEDTFLFRFCPPTFDDPDNWGIDIWIHWSIGPESDAYLCLEKMLSKPCPICEAKAEAERSGDEKFAKSIKAKRRVLAWIIDRDNEKSGPILWPMPWTFDKDVAGRCVSKRTQAVLHIDDPAEGYDVEFKKAGKGLQTKYTGVTIDRDPSYLHKDPDQQEDWIDFCVKNPLPDTLQYFSYEHIAKVFGGGESTRRDDDDGKDGEPVRTRRERRDRDEDERGSRSRDDDREERGSRSRSRDEEPERESRRSHGGNPDDDDRRIDDVGEERPARSRRPRDEEPERERSADAALDEPDSRRSRRPRDEDSDRGGRSRGTETSDGSRGDGEGRRRIRDRVEEGLDERDRDRH